MLAVVVGAFVWAYNYQLNVYALTPGYAQPVGPLITVHDHVHATGRRTIFLTDVYLSQLSVLQWVKAELDPSQEEQVVNGSELVDPGVPTSELDAQGYLEMYDSQNAAKDAAMTALHLHVTARPIGLAVVAVASPSASYGVLDVADRIVAARGVPVTSECDLEGALAGAVPGRPIALRIERATISMSGTITYAAPSTVTVRPDAPPRGDTATTCANAPVRSVYLGIGLEPAVAYTFPVSVSIDTAYIGGPSAGLAMTLGIIDDLSAQSITGTLKVAATGTIDPQGDVGDVGGVAQKTIAVEQAGATVFLVPPEELSVASHAASKGLDVVAVSSLSQALATLERLGGHAPVPLGSEPKVAATS